MRPWTLEEVRRKRWRSVALAAAVVFAASGMLVVSGRADAWDAARRGAFLLEGTAVALAAALTRLGDTWFAALAVLVGGSLLRWRRPAVFWALAVALTWLATHATKVAVGRERPEGLVATSSASFPSGHAAVALALYVGFAALAAPERLRRPAWAVAIPLTALVAWTRLALGVHHVTDVVGGLALGLLVVALVADSQAPQARPAVGDEPPVQRRVGQQPLQADAGAWQERPGGP